MILLHDVTIFYYLIIINIMCKLITASLIFKIITLNCENYIFFGGGVSNKSENGSFHRKHRNRDANHSPLAPSSEFQFFRALDTIPFRESLHESSFHC